MELLPRDYNVRYNLRTQRHNLSVKTNIRE